MHKSESPPFPVDAAAAIAKKLCAEIIATAKKHNLPVPDFESECQLGEVLGCGTYGCALETADDDCVFKLTTDSTEAHFAAVAIKLRQEKVDPAGMVDLRAVFATGLQYEGYNVFVIWRERAVEVGLGSAIARDFNACNMDKFRAMVDNLWDTGNKLFQIAVTEQVKRGASTAGYWTWMRERVDVAAALLRGETVTGNSQFAYLLAKCAAISQEIERASGESRAVGHALVSYLENGIVLTDIHQDNIGVVERKAKCPKWVVVDPGHALVVKEEYSRITIPLLKG